MTAALSIIGEFGACRRGSHGVSFALCGLDFTATEASIAWGQAGLPSLARIAVAVSEVAISCYDPSVSPAFGAFFSETAT